MPQVNVTDYGLGSELWLGIRIQEELIKRLNDWSDQFLNGTSAHNRPFQCHMTGKITWRVKA